MPTISVSQIQIEVDQGVDQIEIKFHDSVEEQVELPLDKPDGIVGMQYIDVCTASLQGLFSVVSSKAFFSLSCQLCFHAALQVRALLVLGCVHFCTPTLFSTTFSLSLTSLGCTIATSLVSTPYYCNYFNNYFLPC